MWLGLDGRSVLVTGAGSGIGRACVAAFRAEGARVTGLDLAGADLRVDVTDEAQVAAAVDRVDGIDVLVCCAGISGPVGTAVADTELAEFARVLTVNVTGQFLVVKHALRQLRNAADPAVVLLASDSAFVSVPGMAPYCASKGAVVALTRALSVELTGVRVNCVCPSIVDTPMARNDLGDAALDAAEFPVQTADEVAAQVLYLASPRSRTVNGQALLADFGWSARSTFPA